MSQRYVVIHRTETHRPLVEAEGVDVVSALDRGFVIDADPPQVANLQKQGWRVKAVRDPHTLRLFTYEIDTAEGTVPPTPPEFSTLESDDGINHLLQLVGPVQESWLATLAERGIRIVEAVSPHAYYVRGDAAAVASTTALEFVEWTGPLSPAYKVNPELLSGNAEAGADRGLGPIEAVDIGVLDEGDIDGVVELVVALGGNVVAIGPESSDAFRSITAQLPTEALPTVAARDDVRWIDAVHAPVLEDERSAQIVMEDLNATPAPNTLPNTGYAAQLTALGIDGAGVTIAVCDTGIDTNDPATVHADVAGRLAFVVTSTGAALAGADTDGHGTHVAGIAAGNGSSGDVDPQGFLLGQGVAPAADVGLVQLGGTVEARVRQSALQGADVMNNSWSMNGAGYSADDRTIDLGVRDADPTATDQTPMVIVFSAGNSGSGASTVTKNPKNAILVGNSLNARPGEMTQNDDIRGLAGTSSRGPATDGRMLPTVVAPGTDIISTFSPVGFRSAPYTDTGGTLHPVHAPMSGTSMASPHVAGNAALLIDWWRQTRNGRTPSPALVKALMISSTEPVTGGADGAGGTIAAGPNNNVGWGRVSIENALLQSPAADRGPKILVDQRQAFTAMGQEYTIRVAAADAALPLRVVLSWSDAPATIGANPALVNDLDLEVRHVPTNQVFLGNVFAGAFSSTGGVADDLNNTEAAVIQNPTGVYEVTVIAANIAASARTDIAGPWQDFALVIDNAEVPAGDPVSVVTVLDRSGSMQTFGYVDIARQTSRQFIDLMGVDDSVAVVSFGNSGDVEYPGTGIPQQIVDQSTRDAATAAVDGVGFGGCTFMGAGIQRAGGVLSGSGTRRAMVLLSDGYDNKGCDEANPAKPWAVDAAAALPADLPIHSCAMGPASDQTLLAELANSTAGRYYFMPTIDDLFEIYNYIRGQVTGDGVIVNESSMASVSQVSGWVDGCAESAMFTVAWHDRTLRHVSREPKGPGEIAVRLRSPGGRWLPRSATEFLRHAGDGYVSFTIHDPQPGRWTVEVATDRRQHTPYTVGGFVRSPLTLQLDVPTLVRAGDVIDVKATVGDRRGGIDGIRARASITSPVAPIADVLDTYRDQFSRITLPRDFRSDGKPEVGRAELARLVLLRDQLMATTGEDILAPRNESLTLGGTTLRPARPTRLDATPSRPVSRFDGLSATGGGEGSVATVHPGRITVSDPRLVLRPQRVGVLAGTHERTKIPGSYSVTVTATGFSPTCQTRFVRKDFASVVVVDKG
ncbi:S8 family serine peptidase [Tessaracoccus antarcticus]|uniref:VWA domain-containing protein n=1 Tax=Tessaracoccus antarcticus TaxID=2479848 RepID=A0A3M0GB16_9ACTN|nr:S8 family serine peptidase [Tessaracoccus antarcticus]RMB61618.1 VWA domain-containing protein [Tessaracoccus antarcticus]